MSLSKLATTSFPSIYDATLPPSAFELRHIILDPEAIEKFSNVFSEDATSMSHLRHISFVSQSIKRLEYELDCHHKEEQEFYEHVMKDDAFRKPVQHVTHDYRQRTRAKGFHPYHHRPLAPSPASISPKSSKSRPSSKSPPSSSSCATSQSTSDSTSYESGMSIIRAYLDQERQQNQHGSLENPIVVDVSDGEEPPTSTYRRRPSMSPRYHPRCEQCGQIGHEEPNCTTPRRVYIRCEFCAHLEEPQRLCTHYNMSPKRRKFLRRKLGLPENPD